jgi:TRAP-type C4-dicarboxylate transport system substrate-binding protein
LAGCSGDSGGGGDSTDTSGGDGGDGDGDSEDGGATTTAPSAEALELTMAYVQSPESTLTQTVASEFVDRVEEETDGRITIDLEAGTLGGSEDVLDATQSGSVDMVAESPEATATRFASEYTFAGDPFVVRDVEHYRNIEQEVLLPEDGMNGQLIDQGLRMFEGYRWGNRGVTANKVVTSPEDVQGLQMRLPQFDSWVGVWEEIGVEATPVAFDELYSALESGVAESSEGPITQFMSTSLYEVQTHFSETNHLLSMHNFIMNEEVYQSLGGENREFLEDAMATAATDITESVREQEESVYEAAREEGTTITRKDDIDRQAFVEAGRPYLETLAEESWAMSFNEIQEL